MLKIWTDGSCVLGNLLLSDIVTEIQIKLDVERRDRSSLEERLLESEKMKNELSVDMSQLQSQITSLKSDLRNENEKV